MSLADLPAGHRARIREIRAGRAMKARLMSMGLRPGVEIRVMNKGRGGPVMIAREDCRMALGAAMSRNILVEEIEPARDKTSELPASRGRADRPNP